MADGYLEKHQQDYEARKAQWLRRQKHLPRPVRRPSSSASSPTIPRPDHEDL
jgi:hypothetical protein